MSGTEVAFTPVPITGMIGCCVPVLPGTVEVDAPLDERTELCAMDANWLVGMVPTCDHHARVVCEMVDIDWPGLLDEAHRLEARPWNADERHSQAATRGPFGPLHEGCPCLSLRDQRTRGG